MKEYSIKIGENAYSVSIDEAMNGKASVTVNGTPFTVEYDETTAKEDAPAPVQQAAPAAQPAQTPSAGEKSITSPLPGVVIEICVEKGQSVSAGQKVAVVEAMKMENEIQAPCSGTVKEIRAAKGDSVPEGEVLMTIA